MIVHCCVCQESCKRSEEGEREELITIRGILPDKQAAAVCFRAAFVKRVANAAKKGREKSLLLSAAFCPINEPPRLVFELGLCQEVQTQRRGRENESSLYLLSPSPVLNGTFGFCWVCEERSNPGEEEESICVVITNTPAEISGTDADFDAGPVN
jgi:hypothetical protein